MSDDVLITPASRKIEFKDSSGNVDGKIELNSSGDLNITAPGGGLNIGDTSADVYIGNGSANVDIIFEQSGEIRAASGQTITLGASDSNISVAAQNFTILSTDAGATEDPSLILYRNSSSPALDDELGEIVFRGRNDNSEDIDYVKVYTEIKDETDGTESGALKFEVMKDGTLASWMTFSGEANQTYVNKKFNMQNNNIINIGNLTFEGSTSDTNETTLAVTDPTADRTITLPNASGTVLTTGNSDTPTTTTSSSDADFVLIDDGGTMKKITPSNLGIGGGTAADDITAGDANVNITTNNGTIALTPQQGLDIVATVYTGGKFQVGTGPIAAMNGSYDLTLDAHNNDRDIIFKGKDNSNEITALTLDMSEAGKAIFNAGAEFSSTDAGATDGPILKLIRDSASPAVGDRLGRIEFKGDSSTGVERTYAAISCGISDPSNTAEDGFIEFIVSADGALNTSHKSTPLILTENAISIDTGVLNFTASSVMLFDAANTITLESNTGVTLDANVTVVGHVLPDSNDVYDLGSSSKQWRDIYTGDINLNNTKTRDNEVDGTRGSWTIQEGADDLFLLNRLSGKKYKFKLEEMK